MVNLVEVVRFGDFDLDSKSIKINIEVLPTRHPCMRISTHSIAYTHAVGEHISF